jgi:hypothetical protein
MSELLKIFLSELTESEAERGLYAASACETFNGWEILNVAMGFFGQRSSGNAALLSPIGLAFSTLNSICLSTLCMAGLFKFLSWECKNSIARVANL